MKHSQNEPAQFSCQPVPWEAGSPTRRLRYTRRTFVRDSVCLMCSAAGSAGGPALALEEKVTAQPVRPELPAIVDTNVYLFEWPFRRLKYSRTEALKAKLEQHRIRQAWVGSFECVWHKQLDQANKRLFEECATVGNGFFIPIGTVNPAWPDWRDDLRRCDELYHMPGIRLFPTYHGYTLDHPEFRALLIEAARRALFVQVAVRLEDDRVHHPATAIASLDVAPLVSLLEELPQVRVELLQADGTLRGPLVPRLMKLRNLVWDISSIEGDAGLRRLIDGTHANYRGPLLHNKLVFGSHAPLFPVESAVWKLFESPLTRDELHGIMYENAQNWANIRNG